MKVASTAGISFVYFTFCQLSSAKCYLPVVMNLRGADLYVGTTKPMTNYLGMTVGVKAGYNITITYNDNHTVTEPTIPNPFGNLSVAQEVGGAYMFAMSVSPSVYGLHGVVADAATHVGIAGARVSLSPGTYSPATTSATGAYSFARLLNGTYTLSVSQHGYLTLNVTVAVAGTETVTDVAITNASTVSGHGSGGMGSAFNPFVGAGPWVIGAVVAALVALVAFGVVRGRKKRAGNAPAPPSSSAESPEASSPPPG
jgi:hypothetical protein